MNEIKWQSSFITTDELRDGETTRLTLKGVLIDTTENKNGWCIEEEDFLQLAQSFIGKQLRTDHSENVDDVLGVVVSTEVDTPHDLAKAEWDPATKYTHIHYVANLASKNDNKLVPIKERFISSVSPGVDAWEILCGNCRQPMTKTSKSCNCLHSPMLLKNFKARELSIVATPAYESTLMIPYSFSAAVDEKLNNVQKEDTMENSMEERFSKLEEAVAHILSVMEEKEKPQEEKPAEEKAASEKEDMKSTMAYIEHEKRGRETADKNRQTDVPVGEAKPPEEKKPVKAVAGKQAGSSAAFTGTVKSAMTLKELEAKAVAEMFSLAAKMGIGSFK